MKGFYRDYVLLPPYFRSCSGRFWLNRRLALDSLKNLSLMHYIAWLVFARSDLFSISYVDVLTNYPRCIIEAFLINATAPLMMAIYLISTEKMNGQTYGKFSSASNELVVIKSETFPRSSSSHETCDYRKDFLNQVKCNVYCPLVENVHAGVATLLRIKVQVRRISTCEIENRINNKESHSKYYRSILHSNVP
jgi:hypothetical protein